VARHPDSFFNQITQQGRQLNGLKLRNPNTHFILCESGSVKFWSTSPPPNPDPLKNRLIYIPIDSSRRQNFEYVIYISIDRWRQKVIILDASWVRKQIVCLESMCCVSGRPDQNLTPFLLQYKYGKAALGTRHSNALDKDALAYLHSFSGKEAVNWSKFDPVAPSWSTTTCRRGNQGQDVSKVDIVFVRSDTNGTQTEVGLLACWRGCAAQQRTTSKKSVPAYSCSIPHFHHRQSCKSPSRTAAHEHANNVSRWTKTQQLSESE